MNAKQLTAELSVSRRTLAKWLKAGLPYTKTPRGRQFDPETVISWLVKQGLVAKPPHVVPTAAAAATELGISERAFHTWLAAGCPARVSTGGYDVDLARQWNVDRRQPDPLLSGAVSPMLERYRAARAGLAELELARALEDVYSRAEIELIFNTAMDCHRRACQQIQSSNVGGAEAVALIRESMENFREDLLRRIGGNANETLSRPDDRAAQPAAAPAAGGETTPPTP